MGIEFDENDIHYDLITEYYIEGAKQQCYIVKRYGFVGLLSESKDILIECIYDSISVMVGKFLVAERDGLKFIYEYSGCCEQILRPIDSYKILYYPHMRLLYNVSDKVGLYDFNSKQVLFLPIYDEIEFLTIHDEIVKISRNGLYGLCIFNKTSGKYNLIADIKYYSINKLYNNYYSFSSRHNTQIGYIEDEKVIFKDSIYGYLFDIDSVCYYNGIYKYEVNNKVGIIKNYNNLASYREYTLYDEIEYLGWDMYAVKNNEFWRIINSDGFIVIDYIFDNRPHLYKMYGYNLFIGKIQRIPLVLVPANFQFLCPKTNLYDMEYRIYSYGFEDYRVLNNRYIAFKKDGLWGVLKFDVEGLTIYDFRFDDRCFIILIKNKYENINLIKASGDEIYVLCEVKNKKTVIGLYSKIAKDKIVYYFEDDCENIFLEQPFYDCNMVKYSYNKSCHYEDTNKLHNVFKYKIFSRNFTLYSDEVFEKIIITKSSNFAIFKRNGKYGIVARTGNIIVDALYNKLIEVGYTICSEEEEKIDRISSVDDYFLKEKKCPKCGKVLRLRVNNTVEPYILFWGCESYPKCKYTVTWKEVYENNDLYMSLLGITLNTEESTKENTLKSKEKELEESLESSLQNKLNLDKNEVEQMKINNDQSKEYESNINGKPNNMNTDQNKSKSITTNGDNSNSITENTKEGCFIATAVYGDYNCREVIILRKFRDSYLLQKKWGRKFVDIYYKYSPKVASKLKKYSIINRVLRKFFDYIISILQYKY